MSCAAASTVATGNGQFSETTSFHTIHKPDSSHESIEPSRVSPKRISVLMAEQCPESAWRMTGALRAAGGCAALALVVGGTNHEYSAPSSLAVYSTAHGTV